MDAELKGVLGARPRRVDAAAANGSRRRRAARAARSALAVLLPSPNAGGREAVADRSSAAEAEAGAEAGGEEEAAVAQEVLRQAWGADPSRWREATRELERRRARRGRQERPAEPRWADVPGTGQRLAYREWDRWGNDRRGTVLLLHPLGHGGAVWDGLARKLSQHGWRLLAPDLRGHGQSSRSRDGRYGPGCCAEDVAGLVLELDLYTQPLAAVGAGFGAAVALELASRYPEVFALVLTAGLRPFVLQAEARPAGVAFPLQRVPAFRSWEELVISLQARACGGAAYQSTESAVRGCASVAREAEGAVKPAMDPAFRAPYSRAEALAALAGVRCPMLSVEAERAPVFGKDVFRPPHSARFRRAVLEKAGHNVICDAPLDFYDLAKAFLDEHDAALVARDPAARRPEALNLRPLPEFADLEAAKRALLGRPVPTDEQVSIELRNLSVGDAEEDAADLGGGGQQTALANNPKDYFGMVG